jgi:hypothetical protein
VVILGDYRRIEWWVVTDDDFHVPLYFIFEIRQGISSFEDEVVGEQFGRRLVYRTRPRPEKFDDEFDVGKPLDELHLKVVSLQTSTTESYGHDHFPLLLFVLFNLSSGFLVQRIPGQWVNELSPFRILKQRLNVETPLLSVLFE